MIRLLRAALILLAATAAAGAQTLFERYLAEKAGASPCWARDSDAASADRGGIARFFISHSRPGELRPREHFQLAFGFTLKDSPDLYLGEARCDAIGQLARCSAADDAGRFTLSPEGDHLKLIIGNRLSVAGPQGYSPDLAQASDLVIQLMAAPPEACATEVETQ